MATLNACTTRSRRSTRSRASMTPSQVQAYLLARETLRRLAQRVPGVRPQATEART